MEDDLVDARAVIDRQISIFLEKILRFVHRTALNRDFLEFFKSEMRYCTILQLSSHHTLNFLVSEVLNDLVINF